MHARYLPRALPVVETVGRCVELPSGSRARLAGHPLGPALLEAYRHGRRITVLRGRRDIEAFIASLPRAGDRMTEGIY